MKYVMDDKRFDSIKRFFDRVWERAESFPKKSMVLSLSDEEIVRIFTRKRLKLIRLIKSKKITSISKLADMTHRELSAVDRDLKILESIGVVELVKRGRRTIPIISKELIVLPLIDFSIKKLDSLEKQLPV